MRSIIKNKKAQTEYALLTFVIVVVSLVILSPFVLKWFNSFLTPFGDVLGNQTEEAGVNVKHIASTFVGFWDFVIILSKY